MRGDIILVLLLTIVLVFACMPETVSALIAKTKAMFRRHPSPSPLNDSADMLFGSVDGFEG